MIVNCAFGISLSIYTLHWMQKNDKLVMLAAAKNLRVSPADEDDDDGDYSDEDDEYDEDYEDGSDSDFDSNEEDSGEDSGEDSHSKRRKKKGGVGVEHIRLLETFGSEGEDHLPKGTRVKAKKKGWKKAHVGMILSYDVTTEGDEDMN